MGRRTCQTTLPMVTSRETKELRLEEMKRGRAVAAVLTGMAPISDGIWRELERPSQAAGLVYAAAKCGLGCRETLVGYIWNWMANSAIVAFKLLLLSQTAG